MKINELITLLQEQEAKGLLYVPTIVLVAHIIDNSSLVDKRKWEVRYVIDDHLWNGIFKTEDEALDYLIEHRLDGCSIDKVYLYSYEIDNKMKIQNDK